MLRWPINSRSTLAEGLYGYDAIARLRDANLEREKGLTGKRAKSEDIGSYIRLNWLGTALYPSDRPRTLLIDEIDKSDIDLPNDLLHVFEEGDFEIPELVRTADLQPEVYVSTRDPNLPKAKIVKGQVQCQAFPFVLITSNGERDLPPAFFRRCLRLKIADADEEQLREIIAAHLGQIDTTLAGPLIRQFVEKRRTGGLMANDQLLNALFLIDRGRLLEPKERGRLLDSLLRELNR